MTLVKCDKKILQLFEKILVKKKKRKKSPLYFSNPTPLRDLDSLQPPVDKD